MGQRHPPRQRSDWGISVGRGGLAVLGRAIEAIETIEAIEAIDTIDTIDGIELWKGGVRMGGILG